MSQPEETTGEVTSTSSSSSGPIVQAGQISGEVYVHTPGVRARPEDDDEMVAAARLRVVLDAKLGRRTPERIRRLAAEKLTGNESGREENPSAASSPVTKQGVVHGPAEEGSRGSLMQAAASAAAQGDVNRVEQLVSWAFGESDDGGATLMFRIGTLLRDEQGNTDEAEQWLRQAAKRGHAEAAIELATLLDRQEKTEEAGQWLRQAAQEGNNRARVELAVLLDRQGNPEEAEQWLLQAAAEGNAAAEVRLSELRARRGDTKK